MNLDEILAKLKLDNQKLILVALVVLIIAYVDYAFIIGMQQKNIGVLKPKIEKLRKELDTFKKDSANIENLKKQQVKSDSKVKQVIIEEQLPGLLEQVSNIANKNNMRLMQIKQSKDVKSKEDKAVVAAKLSPLFISLDLVGTYHNIGAFINDLENADKLLILQEIRIHRDTNDPLKQNAALLIKTYVKK